MKHAMKKLTCLLLVAVLLVGAVPFGALAAEFDPTAGMNDNNVVMNGSLVEEVPQTVNEPVVLAPVTQAAQKSVSAAAADNTQNQNSTVARHKIFLTVLANGTQLVSKKEVAEVDNGSTFLVNKALLVNAGVDMWDKTVKSWYTSASEDYSNPSAPANNAFQVYGRTYIICNLDVIASHNVELIVKVDGESTYSKNLGKFLNNDKIKIEKALLSGLDVSGKTVTGWEAQGAAVEENAEVAITERTTIVCNMTAGNAGSGSGSNNGTETAKQSIYWEVKNVAGGAVVKNGSFTPKNDTAAVKDILYYHVFNKSNSWQNDYTCTKVWSTAQQKDVGYDGTVPAGDIVSIVLTPKSGNVNGGTGSNGTGTTTGTVYFMNANDQVMYTAPLTNGKLSNNDVINATNAANRTGYTFVGWKLNKAGSAAASDLLLNMTFANGDELYPTYMVNSTSNTLNSTKNQNDIFLNIFVNKDFYNCKTIKLNEHWVIADDKITKDEILQYVVTDYYKAANGNIGLQADMLYYSVGSFMYNWLTDNGTLTIDNISAKRAQGTVTINIMVTNAAAKGTTGVASDNPKTGDNIYTAFAVMGISAASLAAVMYVYNKKRYTV